MSANNFEEQVVTKNNATPLLVFDSLIKEIANDGAIIEAKEQQHCYCCGFASDDLSEVVLENSLRKKSEHVICGICFEAPYVLDAYLNPWLYENNSKEIMSSMAFLANRILNAINKKDNNER